MIMSLSRQGVLFVAVFLIAAAPAGYKGFIAVHLFADFLSGLIALILFRTLNLGRKTAE